MRSLKGKGDKKRRRSAVAPNPSDMRVLMDPKTAEDSERIEYAVLISSLTDNLREKSLQSMMTILSAIETQSGTMLRKYLSALDPTQNAKDVQTFQMITRILATFETPHIPVITEAAMRTEADAHRMGNDEARIPEPLSAYMRANAAAVGSPADRFSWLATNQLQTELLRFMTPAGRVAPVENCNTLRKRHLEDQEIVDEVQDEIRGFNIMEIKIEPGLETSIEAERTKVYVNNVMDTLDSNQRWADRVLSDSKRRMLPARNSKGYIVEDQAYPNMGDPVSVEHTRLLIQPATMALKPCCRARVNSSVCLGNMPEHALSSVEMPDTSPIIMQQFRRPEEVARNIIPVDERPCIFCKLFEFEHYMSKYKLLGVEPPHIINDFVVLAGTGPNHFHPSLLLPEFDGPNNERRTGIVGNVPRFSSLFRLMHLDKKDNGGAAYKWPMQVQDFI